MPLRFPQVFEQLLAVDEVEELLIAERFHGVSVIVSFIGL